MAGFPSTIGSQQLSLDFVWANMRATATNLKQYSQSVRANVAAGCNADVILNFLAYLVDAKKRLDTYAAVPGIAAYAQTQVNNSSFDITAEYNAMATSIVNVGSWITANFPATGGFIQPGGFNADGSYTARSFTAAALAPLLTLIDAMIATID